MNRKITVPLLAVCCLAVGITLIAQEGGDASSKVEQLEKEMHHAQMNSDASWYEQHLADGERVDHRCAMWWIARDGGRRCERSGRRSSPRD